VKKSAVIPRRICDPHLRSSNTTIEEKFLLFERNRELVRLLLKDGSLYQGSIQKELSTGIWLSCPAIMTLLKMKSPV
jgi:hypothetical protein